MKRFYAFIALSLIQSSFCGTLTEKEIIEIKEEIKTMVEMFEQGDASLLIDQTHESLFPYAGGKENFAKLTNDSLKQLEQLGVKYIESELGTPTLTYPAGEYELCFVPRIATMEIDGKKARSHGFMIAVRNIGKSDWKYLDGLAFHKNPQHLKRLFPELSTDVTLPPYNVETL